MIQEIKIKNFLSFKDEVKFSFEASNDKFAESSQVVQINENTRLLRFAIVYGYNASGKSNLLRVFDFLSDFWFAKKDDMDDATGCIPFKLNTVSPKERSCFNMVFYANNTKYHYELELDNNIVYLEKLSYYKTTQPLELFTRSYQDGQSVISFGPSIKINNVVENDIMVKCLKNMSFFAARNQVNASLPLIDAPKEWMKKNVMEIITPSTKLTNYAKQKTAEDDVLIKYIVDFLHAADFNITNIKTNSVDKPIPQDVMNFLLQMDKFPVKAKEQLKNEKSLKHLQTDFEHTVENSNGTEVYRLSSEDEESRGTIRTFGLECALYNAMQNNAFLAIDEVEASLHPKLLEKILFEYLKTSSKSQLIVTTHNDGLLDLVDDLIRKDSVWFTEKDKAGVTDLYKLTDFRGVNRLSSIREAYRNKRFGATMK